MSVQPCQRLTTDELRQFDLFKDDDEVALRWFSERFEVVCFDAGDVVIDEGDPATRFVFVIEGELQFSRPSNPSLGVFLVTAGEPTGVLPFSRMKTFAGTSMRRQADPACRHACVALKGTRLPGAQTGRKTSLGHDRSRSRVHANVRAQQ